MNHLTGKFKIKKIPCDSKGFLNLSFQNTNSSRCRQRSSDDENRFMSYGRYRPAPPTRHQHHQPNSPHSFNHIHHSHAHLSSHGHSSHHSSHTHLHQDDEGIYESADRNAIDLRDVNDSER